MLWQQKRTQLPTLNIDFAMENKAQKQQTNIQEQEFFVIIYAGERPSLSVFVEISV